ncbi:MAG: hypothetical protein HW380_3465 [Magnetococcales bacterium]|nr:hypothetical protein [Magnetococcales bacterium]
MKNHPNFPVPLAKKVVPESSGEVPSRRQWPREVAAIPMVFALDGGKRLFPGCSMDVSLGGVALKLDAVSDAIQPGMEGWVELNFEHKVHHCPCRVIRIAGENVFVAMDEKQRARFATLVSLMQLSSLRDNFNLLGRWNASRDGKGPPKRSR